MTLSDLRDRYVIVRTYSAGVFAGVLKAREGETAEVAQARRLWYWDGAFTCSDLANSGVSKPDNCKFAAPVELIQVSGVLEVIVATPEARVSLEAVSAWHGK